MADEARVGILGAAQTAYSRVPGDAVTTEGLLAEAVESALRDAGIQRSEVDGLGVASFTLAPDRVIDLGWKLGLHLRWMMGEPLAVTMLQHARRAIQAGDATYVVIVAGDRMDSSRFREMTSQYNRATQDLLVPTGAVGPNPQFSFVSAEYARRHGDNAADAFGQVVAHQRARAAGHPNGLFTEPLTLEQYRAAPLVTSELRLFDCVPLVAGASAVVLGPAREGGVDILGYSARFNVDDQEGDGLSLGLDSVADSIWAETAVTAADIDVLALYDDYPVIVLQQLHELGYLGDDIAGFAESGYSATMPVVNPSGGLLCCGQAGAGGTLHGLVDAVDQVRGRAGSGQVPGARTALVTNYGMVLYNYGACMAAVLIGRA
ncbi:thiolase family protein [soil metagenome]